MSSWYLSNLHHKTVAFNLSNITMEMGGQKKNAIEIALSFLSPEQHKTFFKAGQDFLADQEILNLNEYKLEDLDLINQFTVCTKAINHNDYLRQYPDVPLEAVDINQLIKTKPFALSEADLSTALSSICYQVGDAQYHPILVQLLTTLKWIIFAKKAGFTNYDDVMTAYAPDVVLKPEVVIAALRMSNAFMIKMSKQENGKFLRKYSESSLFKVYQCLIQKFIDVTPQQDSYDEEADRPIFAIKNKNPEPYLLHFKRGYDQYRKSLNHLVHSNIEKQAFLEAIAYTILCELSNDEAKVIQITVESKKNPNLLYPCPTMSEDDYKGAYRNILLLNAIHDHLKASNTKVAENLLEPLIDHIDTCYLYAPDSKARDISARFAIRKTVGRPISRDWTGEYKAVRYGF